MRRQAPRPLATALEELVRASSPPTLLAEVQACWTEVAGPGLAAEATPVSENAGTLTLACRSATWAQELQLLAPDLLDRLNAALGATTAPRLTALRTHAGQAR